MQAHLDFSDYISKENPSELCSVSKDMGDIDAKDLPALFTFLNQHPEITELNIKEMILDEHGWQVLVKLLKANDTLLILHINSRNFFAKTELAFIKALYSKSGNKKLEMLHVSDRESKLMQQVLAYRTALRKKLRRKIWKELIQELRTIAQGFRSSLNFIPGEIQEQIALRLIDSYGFPFSLEQKKLLTNEFIFSRPQENEIENSVFISMYEEIFGIKYAGDLPSNTELEDQSKEIEQAISKMNFAFACQNTDKPEKRAWATAAVFIYMFYPPQGIDLIKRIIPTLVQVSHSDHAIQGISGPMIALPLYYSSSLSLFAAFFAWPSQHYYQSRVPLSTHKKDSVLGLLADFFGFKNYKPLYGFWGMLGLYIFIIPFHLLRMAVTLPWSILKIATEILPGTVSLFFLFNITPAGDFIREYFGKNWIFYLLGIFVKGLMGIGLGVSLLAFFIGTAITSPFSLPRLAFGIAFSSMNQPQVELAFNKYLFIGGGLLLGLSSVAITISFYAILWPLAAQALAAAYFPALAAYLPSLLAFVGLSALTFASNAFAYFGLGLFRPKPTIFYTHDLDNRKPVKQFAQMQKQENEMLHPVQHEYTQTAVKPFSIKRLKKPGLAT